MCNAVLCCPHVCDSDCSVLYEMMCIIATELRGPAAHRPTAFWLSDNSQNVPRLDYTSPAFLSKPVGHIHTHICTHTHTLILRTQTKKSLKQASACLYSWWLKVQREHLLYKKSRGIRKLILIINSIITTRDSFSVLFTHCFLLTWIKRCISPNKMLF